MMTTPRKETTLSPIDRAYEDLVDRGAAGITGQPWSQSTSGFVERQCQRGGCHRPARRWVKSWFLCDPCADVIAEVPR